MFRLVCCAFLALALVARAGESITVSAAASLKDALGEAVSLYKESQPETEIVVNLGGSGALQKQIENGAPVDLFISAAAQQMDALEKAGLIVKETRFDLLANTLVLIAPAASKVPQKIEDVVKPEIRVLAIGEPGSVPVGIYAAETLRKLGLWDGVEPKLVRLLDVGQVLAAVETGNAEAGFVYGTDAAISKKVRIAATAPADSHKPIVYPAAVIAASKNRDAAAKFLEFLRGPEARTVFARFGFPPPTAP